ncbi:Round spore [Balamuthia mandrillaris]
MQPRKSAKLAGLCNFFDEGAQGGAIERDPRFSSLFPEDDPSSASSTKGRTTISLSKAAGRNGATQQQQQQQQACPHCGAVPRHYVVDQKYCEQCGEPFKLATPKAPVRTTSKSVIVSRRYIKTTPPTKATTTTTPTITSLRKAATTTTTSTAASTQKTSAIPFSSSSASVTSSGSFIAAKSKGSHRRQHSADNTTTAAISISPRSSPSSVSASSSSSSTTSFTVGSAPSPSWASSPSSRLRTRAITSGTNSTPSSPSFSSSTPLSSASSPSTILRGANNHNSSNTNNMLDIMKNGVDERDKAIALAKAKAAAHARAREAAAQEQAKLERTNSVLSVTTITAKDFKAAYSASAPSSPSYSSSSPPASPTSSGSFKASPLSRRSKRKHQAPKKSLPAIPSNPNSPSPSRKEGGKKEVSLETRRQQVTEEIISTEEDYVRDLDIIIDVFLKPLREGELLNKTQIMNVFSNIEMIATVNKELFNNLKTKSVGQAFLSVVDYLKLYSVYCGNQENALNQINKLRSSNSEFDSFLEYCHSLPDLRSLDLYAFLIKPIQRICKYPLLLGELLKCTQESHPDHALLTSALQKMKDTVSLINQKKRDFELSLRMYELSKLLEFPKNEDIKLMEDPGRRLISEGPLTVLVGKKRKASEGHYFLFTDLFFFVKPRGKNYVVKTKLNLMDCVCGDLEDEESEEASSNTDNACCFRLVEIDKQQLLLCCSSVAEKDELKKKIDDTLSVFLASNYNKWVKKQQDNGGSRISGELNLGGKANEPQQIKSFNDWKKEAANRPLNNKASSSSDPLEIRCHGPSDVTKRIKVETGSNKSFNTLQQSVKDKFRLTKPFTLHYSKPNSKERAAITSQKDLEEALRTECVDLYIVFP